ncbi:MAG: hypothetical protein L0Y44_13455, partial [Phycisphaerales bacterium]|nr:hypothetical protein [Phycisphaerales bacterium]
GMEQSAWRDGEAETPLSEIARRLAIEPIGVIDATQLVMDEVSVRELVCLCQPTRLLIVAVEGEVDASDARAMNSAVEASRSPLLAELRAVAALEVLGDRSIVLHCRSRNTALTLMAENFRHFLAAVTSRPAGRFHAPQPWQIERLMGCSGAITIRPIETQVFSTSIDVGINTSAKERFSRPADRALIYDLPSGTWHDEA